MLITKTPFRVSFFGGGTDYPEWYAREGGAVLSTTISKYCYITCRIHPPIPNIRHRIVWSHIETPSSVEEILHPAVREALIYLGFDDTVGVEIHHQGDLPARSGIGSSSSFAVGLIKALRLLKNEDIGQRELVRDAIYLERGLLDQVVGSQDQVAAVYGGLNAIYFSGEDEIQVDRLSISDDRKRTLQEHLILFYVGSSRLASKVAADQVANLTSRADNLHRMRGMVDTAREILEGDGCIDDFGRLLHEEWMNKRQLSQLVSTPLIDHLYSLAMNNGALGGKLLGAGGTGFMAFYVPMEHRDHLTSVFRSYSQVPIEFVDQGCQVIFDGREHMQDNLRWNKDFLRSHATPALTREECASSKSSDRTA